MLAKVKTLGLVGIQGFGLTVEVDLSNGLPKFDIVGLPDTAIKESKERVRSAIRNSGLKFPNGRTTVNLAPADLKKEGPSYDLPIAVSLLVGQGLIETEEYKDYAFLGELSLDGTVHKINGLMPLLITARSLGYKKIIIPSDNAFEASFIEGITAYGISNLRDVVGHFLIEEPVRIPEIIKQNFEEAKGDRTYPNDFCYVRGQVAAKRAMEIAAAGGHNLMMIGPPGAGKTMLARCMPSILPDLTFEESLEVTKIHSVAGVLDPKDGIIYERPFRSPHHTTTNVTLTGGGNKSKPGEVSLAHSGVLFLDELPEYKRQVIETLRQPLEDGVITVARLNSTVEYPAEFMLITSMNPCPCGHFGSKVKECKCTYTQIRKYLDKLSGPLLDRIDLHIEVDAISYQELTDNGALEESSACVRARVNKARNIQRNRYKNTKTKCNAKMTSPQVNRYCVLNEECKELLSNAFTNLNLSARAYNRILKVARTIADLDNSDNIEVPHLAEAIGYRTLDKKYWEH